MIRYQYAPGMAFLTQFRGGGFFPQVYYVPVDSNVITFTDDVIFKSDKRGLFQVVVLLGRFDEVSDARAHLEGIDKLSEGRVLVAEATYIVHDPTVPLQQDSPVDGVIRVARGEEFAKSPLCTGRPEPEDYNELRIQYEMGGKKFIVLRPDRFVYAACADRAELEQAVRNIPQLLKDGKVEP